MMTDTRVIHVIDDEEAVRRSVGFLLRTSGFVVHTYASGPDFLRDAKAAARGCILLDIRMPEMDGLAVQHELAARGVALPVIVLTGHGDVATAVVAMRQGAVDFLEKPFEKAALLAAIERGFARLDRAADAALAAQDAEVMIAALTPRERDVLKGLTRGHPNKTIAYDLGISARTVEVYRANIMAKFGAHSLSEVLHVTFAAGMGSAS